MRGLLVKGRRGRLVAGLVLAAATLAACGGNGAEKGTTTAAGGPTARVAFFLPHPNADRYEAIDLPYFSERFKELCPTCTLDYYNAKQSQDTQNTQFREALAKGTKLMVFDPVDSKKGAALVDEAKAKGVPVISYDRIVLGTTFDYLVTFDHLDVGKKQAQTLLDAMGTKAADGEILWINGPPTDSNAVFLKYGAHAVLDGKVKVAAEFTMPGPKWGTGVDEWLAATIPTLDLSKIIGVYSADDASAGKAAKALKAAGLATMPPITGSNGELAALQRVLVGDQVMTSYKPVATEAQQAAEVAFKIVKGQKITAPSTLNNGAGQVPAFFVPTQVVTRDKIKETVLKDGFITVNALCAAAYTDACTKAGIGE